MTTPNVPSAAERARAEAARAQADAGVALARFEALTRVRDADRTRVCLLPLGTDPATAAAPRWAEDRAVDLVAAGSAASSRRVLICSLCAVMDKCMVIPGSARSQ